MCNIIMKVLCDEIELKNDEKALIKKTRKEKKEIYNNSLRKEKKNEVIFIDRYIIIISNILKDTIHSQKQLFVFLHTVDD